MGRADRQVAATIGSDRGLFLRFLSEKARRRIPNLFDP